SFTLQVLAVAGIIVLSRRIRDRPTETKPPRFDLLGAVLGAAGLFFIVFGVLQSGTYGWFKATKDFTIGGSVVIGKGGISPVWLFVAIGALIIAVYFWHALRAQRAHRDPLVSPSLFRNRTMRFLIRGGFVIWIAGMVLLLLFGRTTQNVAGLLPGLLVIGVGVGVMLTASANVVQSAFPDEQQGQISGLSRSASNLGSS